ncbi:g11563 [Coccomyxa elongata]
MGPILPQVAQSRGVGLGTVGLIFSTYAFANFAVSPYLGKALQTGAVQRKTLLFSGLLICGGSAAAFGLVTLVQNPHVFTAICLLLRVVNGVGSAAVDTSSFSMISGLYAGSEAFGTMMGIAESFLSLGWIVGPLVGGYAAQVAGFAAPFFLTAAVTFLTVPVLIFLMPQSQVEGAERPKVPVTIGRLLRQPIVGVLLVAGMLAAGSLTFLDPTLGPFLQRVWGWDVATIGLGFGTTAVLYAIITPFAGWVGDKVGMSVIIVAGFVFMAVGYVLLGPAPPLQALLGRVFGSWLIWVSLSFIGLGAGMAFVPLLPALLNGLADVGIEEEGLADVVSGLLSGSFSMGGGVGPLLGGLLAALLGFEWAAAGFGLVLASIGVAVSIVSTLAARTAAARTAALESAPSMPSLATGSRSAAAHSRQPAMSPRPPLMSALSGHGQPHAANHLHEPLLSGGHGSDRQNSC